MRASEAGEAAHTYDPKVAFVVRATRENDETLPEVTREMLDAGLASFAGFDRE